MKPIKLNQKSVQLITPRIGDEYKAMYHYRAASNWCKDNGFMIAAAYFDKESKEELEHAEGLQMYLVDWNVIPALNEIDAAPKFTTIDEIISKSYSLEYDLYEQYEETSMAIFELPDPCTFDFLQKYRNIQTESVAKYADMLNIIEGVEPSKINMLLIEHKLFG